MRFPQRLKPLMKSSISARPKSCPDEGDILAPGKGHEASLRFGTFEVLFDFFQGFALGFGKEEGGGGEIDYGAGSESKEHGGVTVLADGGKKDGGNGGGDGLVDEKSNAHAVGPDARGHQFGEGEPDAYARTDSVESDEDVEADRDKPAVLWTRHWSDQGVLDFQGSGASRVEIAEGIGKEGDHTIGGHTTVASDFDGLSGEVVGTSNLGGRAEITVGINHAQRGDPAANR